MERVEGDGFSNKPELRLGDSLTLAMQAARVQHVCVPMPWSVRSESVLEPRTSSPTPLQVADERTNGSGNRCVEREGNMLIRADFEWHTCFWGAAAWKQ